MQNMLKGKLWAYVIENNPDLILSLQEDYSIARYIEAKVNGIMPMAEQLFAEGHPFYVIGELCMDAMTADLKPSRYQYILKVLEEEFPWDYERMKESGTLTYEIVNLIEACKDIFSDFDFNTENEDNRHLRYAIIGQVHEYLN